MVKQHYPAIFVVGIESHAGRSVTTAAQRTSRKKRKLDLTAFCIEKLVFIMHLPIRTHVQADLGALIHYRVIFPR